MGKKRGNHKINGEITNPSVRLVGDNVQNNVYSLQDALEMASNLGVDLVMINPNNNPPVCKLVEYNKFLYDQNKKMVQQKPKPVKEIYFTPNIGDNDLNVKVNHIIKFLEKGHSVKIGVTFSGREKIYTGRGETVINKVCELVADYGAPESTSKMEEGKLLLLLRPKK